MELCHDGYTAEDRIRGIPAIARLIVFAIALTSCSEPSRSADTRTSCATIVGGYPDAQYEAVAALRDSFGTTYCTATLIGFSAGASILLTAAHCLDSPIERAAFGSDLSDPREEYELAQPFVHPEFDRSTGEFDFAVIAVSRSIAKPPLAVSTPGQDPLSVGSQIEFVGYGDTEDGVERQTRNAVTGTISGLTATHFDYNQIRGGPCLADSGGPAIALIDERPIVVGVTSHGAEDCWSWGASGRVSAAASFIEPFLEAWEPCATL